MSAWQEGGPVTPWAVLGEAAALQRDYPGVTAWQVPVYRGFGLAARWRSGRRELRVIGPAADVREAVRKDPPQAPAAAHEAPAGEGGPVPGPSPAGHDERGR